MTLLKALKSGRMFRRKDSRYIIFYDGEQCYDNESGDIIIFEVQDILATDYELIN